MIGTDTSSAVIRDIANGVSRERTLVPMTDEVSAYWGVIEKQLASAPPHSIIDIPYDGNDDEYLGHLYHDDLGHEQTINRSYFAECERDEHGRCLPEGAAGSKRQLATRTHKPSTVKKQRLGESEQRKLASALGGHNDDDNNPFDVTIGRNGVEVKCVIDNDNDKVTVHPESRIRKEQEAKRLRLRTHTVAIDVRGGKRVYYYRSGIGAYRLSNMERVSVQQLKERLS